MQIKTFRALDMREALQAIKEELGRDAVILSTKEVKSGSGAFGLFGRSMVEVTAAVDRAPIHPGRDSMAGWGGDKSRDDGAILAHGKFIEGDRRIVQFGNSERPESPATSQQSAPLFANHMQAVSWLQPLRGDLAQLREEVAALRDQGRPALVGRDGARSLEADLHGVRRLVGALVKNERDLLIERLPTPLRTTYECLLDSGWNPDVVLGIVKELHESLPLSEAQLAVKLRNLVGHRMTQYVKTPGPLWDEQGGPKAVMIIGPTGVGKTTTIAKLAAHAQRHKRKVALITLDTYRVAAVEQLRVYGNILGISVDVALTCEDLASMLHRRRNADLILIDTAGRSPLDQTALHELQKQLVQNREVEAHLVLSAATREADLGIVLARFATLPVKSLIFSKLDETTRYGMIVNVLQSSGLPLSYLSTGQRVPEDLELATPRRVADLLLDGLAPIRTADPEPPELGERHLPTTPGEGTEMMLSTQPMPVAEKPTLLGVLGRALTMRSGRKSGA
jgi:flagellar biosynthesis protein FlhF